MFFKSITVFDLAKLCTMYFDLILQNKFYCDSCNKTAAVYFLEF